MAFIARCRHFLWFRGPPYLRRSIGAEIGSYFYTCLSSYSNTNTYTFPIAYTHSDRPPSQSTNSVGEDFELVENILQTSYVTVGGALENTKTSGGVDAELLGDLYVLLAREVETPHWIG
jgi:hypothetical protein